jgi:repressor LexA
MHLLQEKILKLADKKDLGSFTLRQIAEMVGETLPQKVKHHLLQLERKGFISIDTKNGTIRKVGAGEKAGDLFTSIPIVGSARCGAATIYADQNVEGYLKVSKRIIPSKKKLYALRAEGNSLNKASINGKNIDPGDFVIVDSENVSPRDGDYVVSIIDDMANIKKFRVDKKYSRIALISESTQEHFPIFIHEQDNFKISGKVIDVIKNI